MSESQDHTVSAVTAELIGQLEARDRAGLQKYGVNLDRLDLGARDWLQHMTEELLDAAGYAQAARRALVRLMDTEASTRFAWQQVLDRCKELAPEEFTVERTGTNLERVMRVLERIPPATPD